MTGRLRRLAAVAVLAGAVAATSGCGVAATVAGVRPVPSGSPAGAVTPTMAAVIARQVITTAQAAQQAGPAGDSARAAIYAGVALTAADAQAKLSSTLSATDRAKLVESSDPPVVLAVSAGSDYPRQIIARTTLQQSNLPVLYLLVSSGVRQQYRIAAKAVMLPGTSVRAFAPLANGSAPIGDGSDLAITPQEVAATIAGSLTYPSATDRDKRVAVDAWSTALIKAVGDKAASLKDIGTLSEKQVSRGVLGGLRAAGGQGALAFIVLDRTDVLVNKAGAVLTPSGPFSLLSGQKTIRLSASTSTLEFLAVQIPAHGQASVIAASEQFYAASGH